MSGSLVFYVAEALATCRVTGRAAISWQGETVLLTCRDDGTVTADPGMFDSTTPLQARVERLLAAITSVEGDRA